METVVLFSLLEIIFSHLSMDQLNFLVSELTSCRGVQGPRKYGRCFMGMAGWPNGRTACTGTAKLDVQSHESVGARSRPIGGQSRVWTGCTNLTVYRTAHDL